MAKPTRKTDTIIGGSLRATMRRAASAKLLQVVVMVDLPAVDTLEDRSEIRARRKRIAAQAKAATRNVSNEMDGVLKRFGGRRFDIEAGAIGAIAVETTPDGIRAIAALDDVSAVVEDQPLQLPAR